MRHDVAVVGGALVGLTAAVALAARGLRVAIIEAREPAPDPDPARVFDARVSALTPVSWRVMRNLGAIAALATQRSATFERMIVWDRAGFGELVFDAADAGLRHLGVVVENRELEHALARVAANDERIRWYRPARVRSLEMARDRMLLHTDGARVEATLVVAADGTRSQLRALAGIDARERSYQQQALVATVRTPDAADATAWQRFLPTGPLAMLPLPLHHQALVWSTAPEHAQSMATMPVGQFRAALADALEWRLGEIAEVGPRACFPLLRMSAERYLAPRVVLIGDAAHTIHPLAGQGVNLGILDAAVLADVVDDLHQRGRDIGNMASLRRYERSRRSHNALVGDTMSAFHQVFTTRAAPVAWLRNVGFALTQRVAPARRAFINYASGFGVQLPSLALREPEH